MRNCIICNKETEGSVDMKGMKRKFICQPCVDQIERDIKEYAFLQIKKDMGTTTYYFLDELTIKAFGGR